MSTPSRSKVAPDTKKRRERRVAAREGHNNCDIHAVAKRRDGGTRYWCLRHKADATAKYGVRAKNCRAAHVSSEQSPPYELDVDAFRGGIGLWGAVPPVYDTTRLPLDRGIHVHARRSENDSKEVDGTFSAVRLTGSKLPAEGLTISAVDAIYYMVSSVFGIRMRTVRCTYCTASHLDKDWFSVHPHQRHLCASCGRTFRDDARGVGNPIEGIRSEFRANPPKTKSARRTLNVKQADYPGGIQVWGSNHALIWTGTSAEEEGIHVHAFKSATTIPDLDETYSRVIIDGISLDPMAVRYLMAQNAMPHLAGRVQPLSCSKCGNADLDRDVSGFTPQAVRKCTKCGSSVKSSTRLKNIIANPLVAQLEELSKKAVQSPQRGVLPDLLPEAP
jgi:hypothetical protein